MPRLKMLKNRPKILITRLGALGDVLMITPIIRRIYVERKGDCEIYIKTLFPNIFDGNDYVVHAFSPIESPEAEFDIIYNLDWVYERNNDRHVLDAYEDYVFGSRSINRYSNLEVTEKDKTYVNSLLKGVGDFILIHMRSAAVSDPDQAAKNISEDLWRRIIVDLINKTNVTILQIGSGSDLCFGGNERLLDFRLNLSPQQVAVLTEKSKCYLGSDSGPAHIAATTTANMVLLYTIAKVEFFIPFRKAGKTVAFPAEIECQGCLINVPSGGRLNCQRNYECRESFSSNSISSKVIEFTNF